ncbi:MAG: uracil-DNA glycosylase family protein [Pseudomonadota bacterium]
MLEREIQQYYLNAMGLPQWCLRQNKSKKGSCSAFIPSGLGVYHPPISVIRADKSISGTGTESSSVTSELQTIESQKQFNSAPFTEIEGKTKIAEPSVATVRQATVHEKQKTQIKIVNQPQINPEDNLQTADKTLQLEPQQELQTLAKQISSCQLCENRLNGEQSLKAQVLRVSQNTSKTILLLVETPSIIEQQQGAYLAEQYRSLLNAIFQAVNLDANVYITSLLKCLANKYYQPAEQMILKQETSNCLNYLKQELALIRPDMIVTLGLVQMNRLAEGLEDDVVLEKRIGQSFQVKKSLIENKAIPMIATFHPAFLYRNPLFKAKALQNWITIAKKIEIDN